MMKSTFFIAILSAIAMTFSSCSSKKVVLKEENLSLYNRSIEFMDEDNNVVGLNAQKGSGLAVIENVKFNSGTIEFELKGEDVQGKSFVGLAFNIQNDSIYEAVYFRPFNFRAKQKNRREHSIQYIYHPKNTWRYLRENFEGKYEAEFPRKPDPNDWFKVKIEIKEKEVYVYDAITDELLLSVERLAENISSNIGLWTGFNSKGEFRNIRIK